MLQPAEEPTQEQFFWQELWPVGNTCWSSVFLKDCMLLNGPMLEQFLEELQPIETAVGAVHEGLYSWEELHTGAREKCEEGVAEKNCNELSVISIPHPT